MTDLFSQPTERFPVHKHEKGQQNQHILNSNRKKFGGNAYTLFVWFMQGGVMTDRDCWSVLGFGDFRIRCCDIKKLGFEIDEVLMETRFKRKYMKPETIIKNKIHYEKIFNKKFTEHGKTNY